MEEKDVEVVETKEETTETEQVTETKEEEKVTDELDNFEFDEGTEDGSREQNSKETDTQAITKQSKEENHKYAEMRRQHQKEVDDSYRKGLVEGIGGVNPYTKDKIEDDYDIEIYQKMKEIEKRGGDPIEDYAKYSKIFRKEEIEREQAEQADEIKAKEETRKNIDDFKKQYPDVNLKELLQDQDFKDFAQPSIDRGEPIVSAYQRFQNFNSRHNKVNEDKARLIAAKKVASPGSLTNQGTEPVKKSFSTMTDEEFRNWKRVHGL